MSFPGLLAQPALSFPALEVRGLSRILVIAANLAHYGVEQGRYQMYKNQTIPALQKCAAQENLLQLESTTADRMEVALLLIDP